MEAEDVFPDDVDDAPVRRPEAVERIGRGAERRHVVREGVEPDEHDVLRVAGDRDPPLEARARHAQIAEPRLDEADDLVPSRRRLDEARVFLVVLEQRLLVLGEAEEVRLLLHLLDRLARVERADVAGEQLFLRLERLAADAVPVFVVAEIKVAVLLDLLPEILDDRLVALFRRADEVVGLDGELRPQDAELGAHLVDERLRRDLSLFRLALDLEAVLVRPGEHPRLVAAELVVTPQGVGGDRRVRRPEVGRVVDVVDRGRDVETSRHSAGRLAQPRGLAARLARLKRAARAAAATEPTASGKCAARDRALHGAGA